MAKTKKRIGKKCPECGEVGQHSMLCKKSLVNQRWQIKYPK